MNTSIFYGVEPKNYVKNFKHPYLITYPYIIHLQKPMLNSKSNDYLL